MWAKGRMEMKGRQCLKQAVGNYAVGETFWGREEEVRRLRNRVDEGAYLVLAAQRRMGKTSLMREAARRWKCDYHCVFVDVQQCASAVDAVVELSAALHDTPAFSGTIRRLFANALGKMPEGRAEFGAFKLELKNGLTEASWPGKGDALMASLAAADKPVLLFMDEVPVMLARMLRQEEPADEARNRVDVFMSWLRKNSLAHQGKIRMILAGSISFEAVLHRVQLSNALNNFQNFPLEPWDARTALECLQALAVRYNMRFEQGTAEAMVALLGACVPYHVQLFFDAVLQRCERQKVRTVPESWAEELFTSLVNAAERELVHYEERLKLALSREDGAFARDVLCEAAAHKAVLLSAVGALARRHDRTPEQVRDLVAMLQHDGYLGRTENGLVFASNLVRRWWSKRYEYIYAPLGHEED